MFTSRAEYRILLRQDNADQRLTPLSHAIGLASDERMENLESKRSRIATFRKVLDRTSVEPNSVAALLRDKGSAEMKQKQKAVSLLTRPNISLTDLLAHVDTLSSASKEIGALPADLESLEVEVKYEGYIEKEQAVADKLQRLDYVMIPDNFNYHALQSLSSEAREKLSDSKPKNLAAASRISGVSASDLAVLLVHLGR